MSSTKSTWHRKVYRDGQAVLMRTIECDGLRQSFKCALTVAEALIGSEAQKDFSVTADPTSMYVVLHAYDKGGIPPSYETLAAKLDLLLRNV